MNNNDSAEPTLPLERCLESLFQSLEAGLRMLIPALSVLLFGAIWPAAASELLLHCDFDGSHPAIVVDRSGHGADAAFAGFGRAGSEGAMLAMSAGISGHEDDRCFDNRSATGMGSKGRGGAVRSDKFNPGSLDSFQISTI